MIVILKENHDKEQFENLKDWLKSMNIDVHVSLGQRQTVVGLIGDTTIIDADLIRALSIVEAVKLVQEPYKKANREFHPNNSVIDVGGVKIGGGQLQIIAGPCSIESEEQLCSIAESVKAAGATILQIGRAHV